MKLLEVLKNNKLQDIENFLSQRMIKNMEFFKKNTPQLFHQLQSQPIDYNLVLDEKGINIINLHNGAMLYPLIDSQYAMVETHLEIASKPTKNPRWKVRHNDVFLDFIDEKKLPITGFAINQFIKLLKKHNGIKEYYLDSRFMPTTIIYGVLGGLFLEFMREEEVFFHSLLIFEENIDLFRISCYFVDYALLFNSVSRDGLYLCVKNIEDRKIIRSFFASRKITNNFLVCELQSYNSPRLDQISSWIDQEYSANKRGWGSFEDECIGLCNTLQNKEYRVLSYPKRLNIPICVIGNGPSLDSLLPFIKKNEKNMIIFSCGTALKPLKKYGINVDFQIEIERIDYLKDVLEQAPLGDTTLLCGNMVNPNALKLAKEAFLFLRGGSASSYLFDESVMEYSAPFVGNAGISLAMQLGNEILLCGMDCGYIQGWSKHAKNSFYGEEEEKIPEGAIEIKGNQDKKVFADSIFLLSLQNIVEAIRVLKPKMVLNLGFGAYIEGSHSVACDTFELKEVDKQEYIAQIKQYMKNHLKVCVEDRIKEAYLFRDEVLAILGEGAYSKKELFALVDRVFELMVRVGNKNPHLGILFEGTLAHIMQNLLLASLHLPTDDVFLFYAQSLEIIALSFDKILIRYKLLFNLYN